MQEKEKEKFEEEFRAAISQSFGKVKASDDLRNRLIARLQDEAPARLPQGMTEETVEQFQSKLSDAVARSQDWAPEDRVALGTEAKLSAEAGEDLLSERSVNAIVDGEQDSSLEKIQVDEDKVRFVESLRSEVERSTQELKAPESTRKRVIESIEKESGQQKVVPFPRKSQWKRAVGAVSSLAACFALVLVTLFGSTEVALASSVKNDHQNCCRDAMGKKGHMKKVEAMLNSRFGAVPVPPVDDSWELLVSKMCHSDEGQNMIHFLYHRQGEGEQPETMSFHFFPRSEAQAEAESLSVNKAEQISDDEFPVLAWLEGDWVCTASSPDLDEKSLHAEAVSSL